MAPTGYGFFWKGIASPLPLNAAALDEEAATASMCSRVATNYYRHLIEWAQSEVREYGTGKTT